MQPLDLFPNAARDEGDTVPAQQAPARLVLTIEEAAEHLGIGRTLMYALVKSGEVESVRIGKLRRIPADSLQTFIDSLRRTDDSDEVA